MDDIQLTKDSKQLLAIIYKEYLSKINNGVSKNSAKRIGHISDICELVPDWLPDDVLETMYELEKARYVQIHPGSNTIYNSFLLDKTIIYFENKNINTIKTIADWLFKLK
ncbi:hypothetical protein [Lactococcus lactis]|uniref:hypothetical protein n=1 Tax=Lactococcus lactis TaxID=1358 RepID=UPI001F566C68|nr:hypothetical protein [Lactococcus lactis]